MIFKNKKTEETIEVKGYTQLFACSHNSDWEKVKDVSKKKKEKEE